MLLAPEKRLPLSELSLNAFAVGDVCFDLFVGFGGLAKIGFAAEG